MRKRRNLPDSRVLGFDPSKGRLQGVADSTAIVQIRVEDCAVSTVAHWHQPDEVQGWEVPRPEVMDTMRELLGDELTVGMRTDAAAGWAGDVAGWEREFGPVMWQPHMRLAWSWLAKAWEDLFDAIAAGQLAMDLEAEPELRAHLLAARARGGSVGKDHTGPSAPKVDLAAALAYAYRAYLDAKANEPLRRASRALLA